MTSTLAYMIWQPQLGIFWGGLLIVLVACWMFVIFMRVRRRYPKRQTLMLTLPKLLVLLLLLLLFFDPAWAMTRRITEDLRFLLLVDHSSSMDVTDRDETRLDRAENYVSELQDLLPDSIELEQLMFEDYIKYETADSDEGEEPRPTDLAQVIVDAGERHSAGDYDGMIFLTDGGDERFRPASLPPVPLYFLGIGADPGENEDLEISGIDAPSRVELERDFDVDISLRAHGDTEFLRELYNVELELQEFVGDDIKEDGEDDEEWNTVSTERVELRDGRKDVEMWIDGIEDEGEKHYRVLLEKFPEELTHLNNERRFTVHVEDRAMRVLLYTRRLGQNEAVLRRTLARDAGVDMVSLVRLEGERYLLKSEREEEDAFLREGFPESAEELEAFRSIIIGSFPAEQWTEEQMKALAEFVEDGGSAVFLGGKDSFGQGGYDDTPLAPLFPWSLRSGEPELVRGRTGLSLTSAVLRQNVIRGWAERMQEAHPLYLHTLNRPGSLRRGAVSLLNASYEGENVRVLAMQPYGLGRVMGVATDTMWRWATAGEESREAYNHFWRQGIRYLAGLEDGGRFLNVSFDRSSYHPGERAEIDIQVIGDYAEGQLTIEALRTFDDHTESMSVELRPGADQRFRSRTFFQERGNYDFEFAAYVDDEELETYEREMWVGSRLNEGANISVDHSFLTDLGARAGGDAYKEADDGIEKLSEDIESQLVQRQVQRTESLLQFRGIYFLLIMLILVGEWLIRRHMHLF